MADTENPVALYVSAVEGHHVTRFGTGTLIGAERDLSQPGNLRWDTDKIVAIPMSEYLAFKREYDGLMSDPIVVHDENGKTKTITALKKRTREEYGAYQKALVERLDAEAKKETAEKPPKSKTPAAAGTSEGSK